MSISNCMVCEKHKDFSKFTGSPIAKREGMVLTHYPCLDGKSAKRGHLLIESQRHIVHPSEMFDLECAALGTLIRDGITVMLKKLEAEQVYVLRYNEMVPHFHLHLLPRYPNTPKEYFGHNLTDWPEFPKIKLPEVHALSAMLKLEFNKLMDKKS